MRRPDSEPARRQVAPAAVPGPDAGKVAAGPQASEEGSAADGDDHRDLERLSDILDEHRLAELSIGPTGRSACGSAEKTEAWTIAGAAEDGSGASCLVRESGTTCVDRADRDLERATRRICRGKERLAAPRWLESVAELVRSRPDLFFEVSPVPAPAALAALRVRNDSIFDHYLLVKVRGRWWPVPERLAEGRSPGILRVLDASALGSGAVFLAVAESYDGGSELGAGETWIHVFCDDGRGLAGCARKQIGLFRWALAAEERRKYPGGAHSLRARPHIEAELEASVTRDGLLQLSLVYSMLPADRSEWEPEESCLADEDDTAEACNPVSGVERLINDAGLWRLEGGRFVPARR